MRIFYVYPIPGELGWLLFNFLPHMQYQASETFGIDYAVVHVRRGYEGLYRLGVPTDFHVFDYHGDKTEGNAFVLHAPQAYDAYKEHCAACDVEVEQLRLNHDVVVLRLPLKEYRYHRYKMKHRLFQRLTPRQGFVEKWSDLVSSDAIIFHLRHISRSVKKNTSQSMYDAAWKWASKHGRQFITVGATLGYRQPFTFRGVNLMDQTNLDDLIAIFHLGGLVVGSSSGPMHLASLTQTPHIVWGGGRNDIRRRYLETWNPFNTPVDHLTTSFSFSDKSKLINALDAMVSRSQVIT